MNAYPEKTKSGLFMSPLLSLYNSRALGFSLQLLEWTCTVSAAPPHTLYIEFHRSYVAIAKEPEFAARLLTTVFLEHVALEAKTSTHVRPPSRR